MGIKALLDNGSSTTISNLIQLSANNANDIAYIGQDSSSGGSLGGSAFGLTLATFSARNIEFITNSVKGMTLDSSQNLRVGVSNNIIGSDGTANAAAGNIGEVIQSVVSPGSAVTLSTGTTANLTSISLTAGDWQISLLHCWNGTVTGTVFDAGISPTSATIVAAFGDGTLETSTPPTSVADNCVSLPAYKIRLTSTTTYYAVARGTFSVGTLKAYGRITAYRTR